MQDLDAIYEQWLNGDIDEREPSRLLMREYSDLQNQLYILNKQISSCRERIGRIMQHTGAKECVLEGYTATMTAPQQRITYDRVAVDTLIYDMTIAENYELAKQLSDCRKEITVAGSLRLMRVQKENQDASTDSVEP